MFKSLVEILAEEKYSNIKETLSNIYIQKINVNKENNSWDIILNCSLPIPEKHIDIIKQELSDKFGITGLINIAVEEFCYRKTTLEDIIQDNTKLALIINEAFSKKPSINCLLQASEFSIEMSKIIFYIDNEFFLSLIKEKSVKHIFKKHLKDFYNIEAEIEFEKHFTDKDGYNNSKNELDRKLIYECVNSVTQNKTESYVAEKVLRVENIKTNLIFGKKIVGAAESILSINEESGIVIISGEIFKTELKETKNGKFIFSFYITDYTSSITIKFFPKPDIIEDIKSRITEGTFVRVKGEAVNDKFMRELVIMAIAIESYVPQKRIDKSIKKRVELHLHTQMSAMDGITPVSELIKRAKEWGHTAIAITDHGVVQAFPEAMEASKKFGIKIIYGVEGYLVDDGEPLVIFAQHQLLCGEFVIFDIETTGLSNNSDKITEIGAVKIKNYKIIDRFSSLVNPEKPIPLKIVELTGITDHMVKNEPTIEKVLPEFLEFVGDLPVVAHNAKFDTGFIRAKAKHIGKNFLNTIIDTLPISRWLLPDLKKHKLNNVADYLGVNLKNHHRAVDDAEATAMIFIKFLNILTNDDYDAKDLNDINKYMFYNILDCQSFS